MDSDKGGRSLLVMLGASLPCIRHRKPLPLFSLFSRRMHPMHPPFFFSRDRQSLKKLRSARRSLAMRDPGHIGRGHTARGTIGGASLLPSALLIKAAAYHTHVAQLAKAEV